MGIFYISVIIITIRLRQKQEAASGQQKQISECAGFPVAAGNDASAACGEENIIVKVILENMINLDPFLPIRSSEEPKKVISKSIYTYIRK